MVRQLLTCQQSFGQSEDAEMIDKSDINQALLVAMVNHNKDIVDLLLTHGADPNFTDGGRPPIFTAIDLKQPDILGLLLKHGCNPNDTSTETPLHHASRLGNVEMMDQLVRAGANIHARDKIQNVTPLCSAVQANQLDAVKELLNKGACAKLQDSVWQKRSCLHWAVFNSNRNML